MPYKDLNKKRDADLRWYYRNKDRIRLSKVKNRQDKLKFIQELKSIPCKDCGIKYPSFVMDFDHIENDSKLETVNRLASTRYGWSTLKAEIEKCDVVCANCHRIRTYKRLHINASTLAKEKL